MKNLYRKNLGKWGESAAADYLVEQGCTVLERNVRTPEGEIDLVVETAGELRFVEVKTRTSARYGYPEEAISQQKFEHMRMAAEWYMAQQDAEPGTWHLDVVAITGKNNQDPVEFEWYKDVEVE